MSREPGNSAPDRGLRAARTPLLIAGAFVCLAWAVVLGQAERSVFARVPVLDEVWYLDRAAALTGAAPADEEPAFMSPLYPVLVAAAGAGGGVPADRVFTGGALRGLRLLQIGCWLGTLALLRVLAGRVAPPELAGVRRQVVLWGPVALYALYRPAAVYSLAVLLEAPLVLLVTAAAVLATGAGARRGRPAELVALGVVIGLAGLLRGTALLLGPVAVAAALAGGARDTARSGRVALLAAAGAALVLLPPTVLNSVRAGRPVGPTLNAGVNLYIGNGPDANGFYVAAVPGDWRADPAGRRFLADRLGRAEVSAAAADSVWRAEAWRHVRAHPGRIAGLFAKKLWLQVQAWEIDQLTPLAGWTRTVPALRLWIVPYALLVVLGVAGLAASGRGGPPVLRWLGLMLAALLLGQAVFFVVSRYRLALVPFWCVAAGWGALRLAALDRRALMAAAVAAVVVVPWGLGGVRADWAGLAQANEALRWAELGEATGDRPALETAAGLYGRSLAVVSDRPASWLGLAAVRAGLGDAEGRLAALREGIGRVDDPLALRRALLAALLERGDEAAAGPVAEAILRDVPDDADALHNLIVLQVRTGRPEAALPRAERFRDAHPDDPRAWIDLGVVQARLGRRAAARETFTEGLTRFPGHEALRRNRDLVAD